MSLWPWLTIRYKLLRLWKKSILIINERKHFVFPIIRIKNDNSLSRIKYFVRLHYYFWKCRKNTFWLSLNSENATNRLESHQIKCVDSFSKIKKNSISFLTCDSHPLNDQLKVLAICLYRTSTITFSHRKFQLSLNIIFIEIILIIKVC